VIGIYSWCLIISGVRSSIPRKSQGATQRGGRTNSLVSRVRVSSYLGFMTHSHTHKELKAQPTAAPGLERAAGPGEFLSRFRDSSHAEFVTLPKPAEFMSHRRLTPYLKAQSARKLEHRSSGVRGPRRSTVRDSSTHTGDSYTIEGPGGHASRNHNP